MGGISGDPPPVVRIALHRDAVAATPLHEAKRAVTVHLSQQPVITDLGDESRDDDLLVGKHHRQKRPWGLHNEAHGARIDDVYLFHRAEKVAARAGLAAYLACWHAVDGELDVFRRE